MNAFLHGIFGVLPALEDPMSLETMSWDLPMTCSSD
jgi:hypothetical protein